MFPDKNFIVIEIFMKEVFYMKTIRVKIIAAIVLCSLITAMFVSVLSISNARGLSDTLAENELVLTCSNQ